MKDQLELTFDACPRTLTTPRRERIPGARWWFQQMHAVVDAAFDWTGKPQPRPEQTYMVLAPTRPFRRCASRPVTAE
jgi:predicted double-glycine peptidase